MPPSNISKQDRSKKPRMPSAFAELMYEALNQSADPIFIISRQGNIEYANKTFTKLRRGFQTFVKKNIVRYNILKPVRSVRTIRNKNGDLSHIDETVTPINIKGRADYFLCVWKNEIQGPNRYSELYRKAFYDLLTKLPNRALLLEKMEIALKIAKRKKHLIAILFIDLDKFKSINDNYGHAYGDIVLKLVSQRLLSVIKETDTVARLGGDEFIILLGVVKSVEDVRKVAELILGELKKPFKVKKHSFKVEASIGISIYPDHAQTNHGLMHIADLAMKQVEKRGGGDYQVYVK